MLKCSRGLFRLYSNLLCSTDVLPEKYAWNLLTDVVRGIYQDQARDTKEELSALALKLFRFDFLKKSPTFSSYFYFSFISRLPSSEVATGVREFVADNAGFEAPEYKKGSSGNSYRQVKRGGGI